MRTLKLIHQFKSFGSSVTVLTQVYSSFIQLCSNTVTDIHLIMGHAAFLAYLNVVLQKIMIFVLRKYFNFSFFSRQV